ncbi:hypothetical protein ACFV3E_12635 [Streptomyces sp. NPDC059718]
MRRWPGTVRGAGAPGVDVLARAVVRCFDEVAKVHGADGYRNAWGRKFPRTELEALRRLWRERASSTAR